METSSEQAKFFTDLAGYQQQVIALSKAVEAGDLDKVKALVYYEGNNKECFQTCLANALAKVRELEIFRSGTESNLWYLNPNDVKPCLSSVYTDILCQNRSSFITIF